MHKIILSNGINFYCSENETILQAAKRNEIAIEHSCSSGRCGVCISPVMKGKTKPIISEENISNDQLNSGKILSCCRSPLSEVHLDISDLGEIGKLKVQTLPCRIDSIDQLNKEVMKLILRLPPSANFKYIPGQYINLIYSNIKRSYSLANALRKDGKLELHIKKVDQGLMSSLIFSEIKENDLFRIEGPLGTFSYRDNEEKNVILLATGTGIAPIKAFIESFTDNIKNKNLYVIWGGRKKEDLYFDINSLSSKLTYMPVLSREKRNSYFYGYVQEALINLNLNLKDSSVYACGSEVMIKDAYEHLLYNGLPHNRFYSDAFVSSN